MSLYKIIIYIFQFSNYFKTVDYILFNKLISHCIVGILKKIVIFSSAITLVLSQESIASKRLSGAGASFFSKIYIRWFFDLPKSGGPTVNYQAVGSGSGSKAFIDQTVNFRASGGPLKDKDKVSRRLVQIPMVGGTISFGNNYDCDLKHTQEQTVRVAMGMVKNWKENRL